MLIINNNVSHSSANCDFHRSRILFVNLTQFHKRCVNTADVRCYNCINRTSEVSIFVRLLNCFKLIYFLTCSLKVVVHVCDFIFSLIIFIQCVFKDNFEIVKFFTQLFYQKLFRRFCFREIRFECLKFSQFTPCIFKRFFLGRQICFQRSLLLNKFCFLILQSFQLFS